MTYRFSNPIPGRLLAAVTILGLTVASADQVHAQPAIQRPITDFTSAQGTTSVFLFPVPDYAIGLSTTSTCIPPQCPGRIAVVDGIAAIL
jgi:hypothetical protein